MNLVIPMAGSGRRFSKAGYKEPKPLIDVRGVPMIECVIRSLPVALFDRIVLVVKPGCFYTDRLMSTLRDLHRDIVIVEDTTSELMGLSGQAISTMAASSALVGRESDPVMVANCDQLVLAHWDRSMVEIARRGLDGLIYTFRDGDPKWSYAKVDPQTDLVCATAEKEVISDHATCGIYYWRKWSMMARAIISMIDLGGMCLGNGEYYLCPAYDVAIRGEGIRVGICSVDRMIGLGTPEDLQSHLLPRKVGVA